MARGDTIVNAAIGAVVTVVLSFTMVSPVLGGGVAGYLQGGTRKDGAKVGAISGAIAFLPFMLLAFVFFGFFMAGPMTSGGFGVPGAPELLVILFVFFPIVLVWNAGLGALGGYLGAYFREERDASNG